MPLSNFTSWHVEKFKSQRKEEGKSLSSINRELTVLKRIFNLGIGWKLTTHNPVKGVKSFKIPLGKLRVLSEVELQTLFNSATPHLKPVLLVAVSTGMRRGEVLNLKWEDIDFKTGVAFVRDSKSYESRVIPLSENLKKALSERRKNSGNEYLFCNLDGTHIESVNRSFHTARKRSGIAYCTFHCLKHMFAIRAVMKGVNLATVQELLGHKSIAMTKRYSHPTPERKKKAVDLISIDTSLDTSTQLEEFSETSISIVTTLNKREV